jgi:hypothetical protein
MAKEHKKEKKEKKVKVSKEEDTDMEVDTPRFMSPIAHPLADKKLSKKLYKTVKKGNHDSKTINQHFVSCFINPLLL